MSATSGRPRIDSQGDRFANEHRRLGTADYMNDFDVMVGSMDFAKHTENTMFAEYEPDPVGNKGSVVRQFATVAIFDRKGHHGCCTMNIATKYQLSVCRTLSAMQPVPVRFFWVIDVAQGWEMQELCIQTGDRLGTRKLPRDASLWRTIWDEVGLSGNRATLKAWLKKSLPIKAPDLQGVLFE